MFEISGFLANHFHMLDKEVPAIIFLVPRKTNESTCTVRYGRGISKHEPVMWHDSILRNIPTISVSMPFQSRRSLCPCQQKNHMIFLMTA